MKRIAALGDSLTKGVILIDRNRYAVLEDSFTEILGRSERFQVDNYGKFGCTVDYGHSVADRHADAISESDFTLLEYGGNDCDFDWKSIAEAPEKEHFPKTSIESFRKSFRKLVERISGLGSSPVIISLPPIDSQLYFSFISRFMNDQQKQNVLEWLGRDVNIIRDWHESYNQTLFEIASDTGTPIINITERFDNYAGDMRKLFCNDGIHPNSEGHHLIASSILQLQLL